MKSCFLLALILLAILANGQTTTQEVVGEVSDVLTALPLEGASVNLFKAENSHVLTTTDASGRFRIRVPVGRYRIRISYKGYATYEDEVLVIAGKISNVVAQLRTTSEALDVVEITGQRTDVELAGIRSLTIEKTLRIPANFFDPVRVATAYPGVVATNDQNNSIMVRGNSPNGLSWRLNGLDIVNPNHQANAGTLSDKPAANGGGVNIISAQMLGRTDFYMGALPVRYGNAYAGVIDMELRRGNANDVEYTAQASLIGIDLAAEGPLNEAQTTSFIANYRYSTVGLLSLMGIDFGDEAIRFQDIAFHLNHRTKKFGEWSLFGFAGDGSNYFSGKEPDEWEVDKDRYKIEYSSDNVAVGVNYKVPIGRGKLFSGVAWSVANQERDAVASSQIADAQWYVLADKFSQRNNLLSTRIDYQRVMADNVVWGFGVMANFSDDSIASSTQVGCYGCDVMPPERRYRGHRSGWLVQPFVDLTVGLGRKFIVGAGWRYVYFTFNRTFSAEPRARIQYMISARSSVEGAYGLVSQIQLPQVYGGVGNGDLGMTRSHMTDIAFNHSFERGLKLRSGLFYQYLFNVPVSDPDHPMEGRVSVINQLEEASQGPLVNEGTGRNYGAEITAEQTFFGGHYFMIGGCVYESKYSLADGIEHDTRFNGNYTATGVFGKEWSREKTGGGTIGLSVRALYLGGLPRMKVDASASVAAGETRYEAMNYSSRMDDYFRIDLRFSLTRNKPGYTRTFAIDIQNLTNRRNEAHPYFDFLKDEAVTSRQLGIIPVVVYRIDF